LFPLLLTLSVVSPFLRSSRIESSRCPFHKTRRDSTDSTRLVHGVPFNCSDTMTAPQVPQSSVSTLRAGSMKLRFQNCRHPALNLPPVIPLTFSFPSFFPTFSWQSTDERSMVQRNQELFPKCPWNFRSTLRTPHTPSPPGGKPHTLQTGTPLPFKLPGTPSFKLPSLVCLMFATG